MIEVTESARKQILEILSSQTDGSGIRLSISGRGPQGFEYEITLMEGKDKEEAVLVSHQPTLPKADTLPSGSPPSPIRIVAVRPRSALCADIAAERPRIRVAAGLGAQDGETLDEMRSLTPQYG